MTTLTTPRLTIRPLTEADLPALVAYRNDPEVARFQGWPLPSTPQQERQLISNSPLGAAGWVQRALVTPTGELVGDVGLNTQHPQAELGITLSRAAQGQGYAQEALEALLDFCFSELKLHRVHAAIDPRNRAVARLLLRLGFRHEGTHIQSYWHRGEWTDDAVYAVLREEWKRG
ncbi:hypothetical protein Dxin01_03175 [Deinococcus xinjiangensis]|uniref:N-acetyltransferase domain-containing protein n=1 Tax=Deinococcus xinjiangensis TaxID=457454 RepID=A0ABP9VH68_9DEIO